MTRLPEGLGRWMQMSGPSALLHAVRLRAQRGHGTETGALLALSLSTEQRREIGLLLGTRWEVSGRPVRLQDVAARLAEHGLSVRHLAEVATGGPIEENRALRERSAAQAAGERAQAVAVLTARGISPSDVDRWLADPGLPRAGSDALIEMATRVATVWTCLPRAGQPIRLAALAAGALHDSHALDASEPLGRAVARLVAVAHGLERPQRAGRTWREAWAAAGVRCDGVSSRVLGLNLPLSGLSPAVTLCSASAGEPVWLTLRSLSGDWSAPGGAPVFVCENPTVAEAAADAHGPSCPPLVCTDGIPSGAALDLIAGLASAGCQIVARADIDTAGFTVVEQVLSVAPNTRLWRFDAHTYAAAQGLPRPGDVPAGADPALAQLRNTYDDHRVPLHEEQILPNLLSDLREASHLTVR
jgi:uncharacterized protein (TIGR02679 family)